MYSHIYKIEYLKRYTMKNTRGRPKILDREKIIEIAIIEYWEKGIFNVKNEEEAFETWFKWIEVKYKKHVFKIKSNQ